MKKSVRINLLTITIVVALFVFAGLWYLRPGMSDEVIEQARLRQSQPLMEITPPVRAPRVESVTEISRLAEEVKRELEPSLKASIRDEFLIDPAAQAQLVDTEALKNELKTALRAELLADPALQALGVDTSALKQELHASVKAELLADPALKYMTVDTEALKRELQASIKAELLTDPALQPKSVDTVAITRELQPVLHGAIMRQLLLSNDFIRNVGARVDLSEVTSYVDRSLATFSSTVDAKLVAQERASEQRIDELFASPMTQAGLDPREIKLLIAEAVDEQLPAVVEQVVASIEENKDVYIDVMRQALGEVISEDEVVELYLSYRRDIVQDLVPTILDEIEDQAVDLYLGYREDIIQDLAPPILDEVEDQIVGLYLGYREDIIQDLAPPILDEVEDQVVDLYFGYRDDIVHDLVPPIVDEVEDRLASRFEAPARVEEKPAVIVPPAPVAVEEPKVVVAEPVAVVEEKPAVVTPPAPVVEEKPVVVVPPAPVVEAAPVVIKSGQPKIAPPTIAEPTISPGATEIEYEVERQRLRTEAIDEVLRRISQ